MGWFPRVFSSSSRIYCVRNVFPHPGGPCIQRMGDFPSGAVQFRYSGSLVIHSHVFGSRCFFSLDSSWSSRSVALAGRFRKLAVAIGVKKDCRLLANMQMVVRRCLKVCPTVSGRREKVGSIPVRMILRNYGMMALIGEQAEMHVCSTLFTPCVAT